jgi:hypothetical protein
VAAILLGKSVGVESSLALRYQRKTEINAVQTSLLVGDSNKIGALVVVGASPHDPLGLYLRPEWTWPQNTMQWLL